MGKGFHSRDFCPDRLTVRERLCSQHAGVGANMAIRRDWLAARGGFDTALDVGTPAHGGGDLDMFHRTLAAGGTLRYQPSAIVHHYHRREMRALRRQLYDNGRAFGVYLISRVRCGERGEAVIAYAAGCGGW